MCRALVVFGRFPPSRSCFSVPFPFFFFLYFFYNFQVFVLIEKLFYFVKKVEKKKRGSCLCKETK